MPKKKIEEGPKEEPKVELPAVPVEESPKYETYTSVRYGAKPATKLPDIIGGVCEFCGPAKYNISGTSPTIAEDYRVDQDTQVGKCIHYKGIKVRCSYCPTNANWRGNIYNRRHLVYIDPDNPKQLIMVCDDQQCQDKHWKKYETGV